MPVLKAHQKVIVPIEPTVERPQVASVSQDEMARALAWQPRILALDATPLSEVVAEFNRRNTPQILVADPVLETLHIGGCFRVDQPEAFVRLLQTSFGVAVERTGENRVVLRAAR